MQQAQTQTRRFSLTPDVTERLRGFAELQQADVFAQFGEERQVAEQEAVGSSLVLLLLDLTEICVISVRQKRPCWPRRRSSTHVFIVVRVDLLLQQWQQLLQPAGELLLLHLHVQTADLSAQAPQAGLRTHNASFGHLGNGNFFVFTNLFRLQPGGDKGEQGVLVVQVQVSQQGLNSHGSHFFAFCRVIVDDDERQRDEEETAVFEQ